MSHTQILVVDVTLSSSGNSDITLAKAIFLACDDDDVSLCAHALGVLPGWMPVSALPRAHGLLSARIERHLDRQSILAGASGSIDDFWLFRVDDQGRISCHAPDNVRLTDAARNKARGNGFSARQSNILEQAVLTNLVLRPALGDVVADHVLAELLTALQLAVPDPGQAKGSARAYDFADSHRREIRQARQAEEDWYADCPVSSLDGVKSDVVANCRQLLSHFATKHQRKQPVAVPGAAAPEARPEALRFVEDIERAIAVADPIPAQQVEQAEQFERGASPGIDETIEEAAVGPRPLTRYQSRLVDRYRPPFPRTSRRAWRPSSASSRRLSAPTTYRWRRECMRTIEGDEGSTDAAAAASAGYKPAGHKGFLIRYPLLAFDVNETSPPMPS